LAREHLEDLPGHLKRVISDQLDELARQDKRVAAYVVMIKKVAHSNDCCKRLMQKPEGPPRFNPSQGGA
jgi:transposase